MPDRLKWRPRGRYSTPDGSTCYSIGRVLVLEFLALCAGACLAVSIVEGSTVAWAGAVVLLCANVVIAAAAPGPDDPL